MMLNLEKSFSANIEMTEQIYPSLPPLPRDY